MSNDQIKVTVSRHVTSNDIHSVRMARADFEALREEYADDPMELSEQILAEPGSSLDAEEVQGSELMTIEAVTVGTEHDEQPDVVYRHVESSAGDVPMWLVRDIDTEMVFKLNNGKLTGLYFLELARQRGMQVEPLNSIAEAWYSEQNNWGDDHKPAPATGSEPSLG